ncbi:unnamed protein product [Diplocarpon coronariae]
MRASDVRHLSASFKLRPSELSRYLASRGPDTDECLKSLLFRANNINKAILQPPEKEAGLRPSRKNYRKPPIEGTLPYLGGQPIQRIDMMRAETAAQPQESTKKSGCPAPSWVSNLCLDTPPPPLLPLFVPGLPSTIACRELCQRLNIQL